MNFATIEHANVAYARGVAGFYAVNTHTNIGVSGPHPTPDKAHEYIVEVDLEYPMGLDQLRVVEVSGE